ncbi:DEAD-domain-containing protein [Ramicandelaber brevisporus]|nr:DEAD-domain-containing protein [Ramicandelaber brevisporus]
MAPASVAKAKKAAAVATATKPKKQAPVAKPAVPSVKPVRKPQPVEDESSASDNGSESESDNEDTPSSDDTTAAAAAETEEVTTNNKDKEKFADVVIPSEDEATFVKLGVMEQLCEACDKLNYTKPTPIQRESIPYALAGRDIIGLAQTGSGKTAAFAIPIIQALWNRPQGLFACVLAPTRELAFQISESFEALGAAIGVRCAVIVGGMDMMTQSIALSKKPHIIVCTPGRLQDHLENTKGFNLKNLKFLVMDEADRLLDMDFGPSIDFILRNIPRERNTYLFSATMTTRVAKLQRASLQSPVKVEVSSKFSTVSTLIQTYLLTPLKYKDAFYVYLLNEMSGNSVITFTRTCNEALRLSLMLRNLGFHAIPLHGKLTMQKRLGALTRFKAGARNIMIATDVAARGLDIPQVDVVINYDVATDSKSHVHRIGRTARAGRSGKAISMITQYDLESLQRIEHALGYKLDAHETDKDAAMLLQERVSEAQRFAAIELKESQSNSRERGRGKRSRGGDDDDDNEDGGAGGHSNKISMSSAKAITKKKKGGR